MSLRGMLTDYSKGDSLGWFWRLYWLRKRTKSKVLRDALTFLLNRSAHRHGGYIGPGRISRESLRCPTDSMVCSSPAMLSSGPTAGSIRTSPSER